MKGKIIISLALAAALMSSCHIYKSYERPDDLNLSGLYRDPQSNDTLSGSQDNFGNVPWREVFTDPTLQSLIEEALENNADIRKAALTVEQAHAALTAARLSYLPSLTLSPTGTIASKNVKTYQLPATASWQIDLFGQLLNQNRSAKASYQQTLYYQQAVQSSIISATANMYYTLLLLDNQLETTDQTCSLLENMVEAMEAMKEAAMTNSAAVESTRTSYAQVKASVSDLKQNIREVENAFSLILNRAGGTIERGKLLDQQLPTNFSAGVPLEMLSNRPDVMASEMNLAACYYNTNTARASFYPNITINGQAGWSNTYGNPAQFLAQAIGSITQPLFYRGKLVSALKQAKAAEESAKIDFQTALLKAGNEVSDALYQYEMNTERAQARTLQVASAKKAAEDTKDLFELGNSTYLEVLTAQQSYLSAQLAESSDTFDRMQAVISLYQALGGGREIEQTNE